MTIELKGEEKISAPIAKVWASINDPSVLRSCIPGCESRELTSPTEMAAVVTVKIGPIKAKFNGAVTLSNINPPTSYTIAGEGKGGAAGFAKGGADVDLQQESERVTILRDVVKANVGLRDVVKANVGGKLAQLGSRLIASSAQKLSSEFFANLNSNISEEPSAQTSDEAHGLNAVT